MNIQTYASICIILLYMHYLLLIVYLRTSGNNKQTGDIRSIGRLIF